MFDSSRFYPYHSGLLYWHRCSRVANSQGNFLFIKVREKSGNSVKNLGKSLDTAKSGNSQGILWWMLAILFFLSQSYTFMFLILVPQVEKSLHFFLCCVILSPYKSSREENVRAGHSLLTYWGWDVTYYFVSQVNFHLHYHEAKITYCVPKIL